MELKTKGNAAFQNRAYDEAIRLFSDAIDLNPKDHILYSNRSGAYAANGEYFKAKQDALKCISLNPKFAKAYGRLGLALFYLKDFKESIKAYDRGLAIEPKNESLLQGRQQAEDSINASSPNYTGKRKVAETPEPSSDRKKFKEMSKAELVKLFETTALFREKNEILKVLDDFPSEPVENDEQYTLTNLKMKEWPIAHAFQCTRCDKPKISTMKASFENSKAVCNSCFEHLTRCVIPYKSRPSERPERCVHQVPKGYQKQYR